MAEIPKSKIGETDEETGTPIEETNAFYKS